jgi:hypothetical protein
MGPSGAGVVAACAAGLLLFAGVWLPCAGASPLATAAAAVAAATDASMLTECCCVQQGSLNGGLCKLDFNLQVEQLQEQVEPASKKTTARILLNRSGNAISSKNPLRET